MPDRRWNPAIPQYSTLSSPSSETPFRSTRALEMVPVFGMAGAGDFDEDAIGGAKLVLCCVFFIRLDYRRRAQESQQVDEAITTVRSSPASR